MKKFELTPTNGRKSFNGKAIVTFENNVSVLRSFGTIVATYDHLQNTIDVKGYFSPTTAMHINAFLEFYGFDKMSKQELINLENNSYDKTRSI